MSSCFPSFFRSRNPPVVPVISPEDSVNDAPISPTEIRAEIIRTFQDTIRTIQTETPVVAIHLPLNVGVSQKPKKIAMKNSNLLNVNAGSFENICSFLSYDELSQLVLVSSKKLTIIQAALCENPVPFQDLKRIDRANKDSQKLLDEMDLNFDKSLSFKSEIEKINEQQQPLRYLNLQILAARCCIGIYSIDERIKECGTIPAKRVVIYRQLKFSSGAGVMGHNILLQTIWGRKEHTQKDGESDRKTFFLTKNLIDLGLNLNNYTKFLGNFTFINVCLAANSVNHLRLLIERGANLHLKGSNEVHDLPPLMAFYKLVMEDEDLNDKKIDRKKMMNALFEYLPNPFKLETIWLENSRETLSANQYVAKSLKGRGMTSPWLAFYTYKNRYTEIKNQITLSLDKKLTKLVFSYIRS